ncbi:MAG: hypothetical protein ABJO57_11695 [Lentilitoribacter sp.]
MITKRIFILFISYIIVTFILAYIWHLELFGESYAQLGAASLRPEPIFQYGLFAIITHAVVFVYFFQMFYNAPAGLLAALKIALGLGAVITAYAAFTVAAKFEIEPARQYVMLELAFGLLHYTVIGVLYYWLSDRMLAR